MFFTAFKWTRSALHRLDCQTEIAHEEQEELITHRIEFYEHEFHWRVSIFIVFDIKMSV